MDYALFISLALYCAYIVMEARSPRRDGRGWRVTTVLLVVILFYTILKYVFINAGIQSR